MANLLLTTRPSADPRPVGKKERTWRKVVVLVVSFLTASVVLHGRATLYLDRSSTTSLHDWINSVSRWITFNRDSNPFFLFFINQIRAFINGLVNFLQNLISQAPGERLSPIVGWLGVVGISALIVFATSRLRIVLLVTGGLVSLGLLGYWTESMQTLAMTLAAVILALLIGIPLGVLSGTFPRIEKILTPLLDFSQIMPTFVYLTPITLFFLIGPASATIVTLIYAIPPVLRITSIALKQVPYASVEAGVSMGSTKWEILRKIQLPLAKRTVIVGINQTIMAALSMVTIASLIDAPGLGRVIITALEALDVGTSVRAGLGIVILAIILDRSTTAAADRVSTQQLAARVKKRRRAFLVVATALTSVAIYLSYSFSWAAIFPGTGALGNFISRRVDLISGWIQLHWSDATSSITNFISYKFINPLQWLLAETPWYVVCVAWVILAYLIGGRRIAIISIFCLGGILGTGLWSDTMVTLASTFFAAIVTVLLGIVIGVWIGRSKKADSIIRPILDAGQVLPAFVYLVPFLGLFGATRFTAILAAIVYASPAAIKLAADGIRGVPVEMSEAALAAGSTPWQMITKVQLPAARRGIALATNQGLIYVLAMIVVGGLVGAGGLGYLVVAGFSQEHFIGKGLSAGLAIVFLGVMLDRITQAAAGKSPLSEVSAQQ